MQKLTIALVSLVAGVGLVFLASAAPQSPIPQVEVVGLDVHTPAHPRDFVIIHGGAAGYTVPFGKIFMATGTSSQSAAGLVQIFIDGVQVWTGYPPNGFVHPGVTASAGQVITIPAAAESHLVGYLVDE